MCPYLFLPTPFIIWVTLGCFLAVLPLHTCPLIHPPTHNHSECISLWFFLAGGKYSCNYTPCLQFPLSSSFIPSCSHKLNLTHSHAACFSPSYPLGLSTFSTFPEISAFHPTLFSPPLVCFPTLFPPPSPPSFYIPLGYFSNIHFCCMTKRVFHFFAFPSSPPVPFALDVPHLHLRLLRIRWFSSNYFSLTKLYLSVTYPIWSFSLSSWASLPVHLQAFLSHPVCLHTLPISLILSVLCCP